MNVKGIATERAYYENEVFWDPSLTREEDRQRVDSVASLVPAEIQSLLDVGCGNGLFVHALLKRGGRLSRVCAVDRSAIALRHVHTRKAMANIDGLPYRDRSFDMVTCLEVIEHLPVTLYGEALRELCRVSARRVLITVPYRQDLTKTLIRCPSCESLFNPDYHVRSFDETTLRRLLLAEGFVCDHLEAIGAEARLRCEDWILRLRGFRPGGENPFCGAIPCPVCCFSLPPRSPALPGKDGGKRYGIGLRARVKAIWPKRLEPAWMAATYIRENP